MSQNPKLSVLTENWQRWYLGGVDSESGFRFSKFQPQNPFLDKFGTHGTSEGLIQNLDLDFQNSDPNVYI